MFKFQSAALFLDIERRLGLLLTGFAHPDTRAQPLVRIEQLVMQIAQLRQLVLEAFQAAQRYLSSRVLQQLSQLKPKGFQSGGHPALEEASEHKPVYNTVDNRSSARLLPFVGKCLTRVNQAGEGGSPSRPQPPNTGAGFSSFILLVFLCKSPVDNSVRQGPSLCKFIQPERQDDAATVVRRLTTRKKATHDLTWPQHQREIKLVGKTRQNEAS